MHIYIYILTETSKPTRRNKPTHFVFVTNTSCCENTQKDERPVLPQRTSALPSFVRTRAQGASSSFCSPPSKGERPPLPSHPPTHAHQN